MISFLISNSFIRNQNNYNHQANMNICPWRHEPCNMEMIRMWGNRWSKWEVVMLLLCWEFMWGCSLQTMVATPLLLCACHNSMSRLSLHTTKDSTFLDVFLRRKDWVCTTFVISVGDSSHSSKIIHPRYRGWSGSNKKKPPYGVEGRFIRMWRH